MKVSPCGDGNESGRMVSAPTVLGLDCKGDGTIPPSASLTPPLPKGRLWGRTIDNRPYGLGFGLCGAESGRSGPPQGGPVHASVAHANRNERKRNENAGSDRICFGDRNGDLDQRISVV